MSLDWTKVTLGEIFRVKHGFAFKGEFFTETPQKYCLVTPGNFSIGGGFQLAKAKYYSGEVPQGYILKVGDVVVTMTDLSKQADTLGYSAIIPENNVWLHNQRIGLLEFKPNLEADPLFISYLLRTHDYRAWIVGSATGTTVKHTSPSRIESFECNIPPINQQKKIAKILSDLDEKIHFNNQINHTLESIAQTIFKSWFIDFDPVRAKIAAKQEGKDSELAAMCAISGKSEEELQQMSEDDFAELQATAALFPDELVESELGAVPRGWGVGCVGDEVSTISKTYPLKQVEEVIFLNTGDILEGKFLHANKSRTESLPGQAKKSIQKDDILYSEIRPQNKRFAYVHFDAEDYVVSTKLMVLRKKSTIPSHFVYFILSRQSTIDFLQVMAESRSGTFPQITFDVLSKVEYLKPNNNALIDIFTRKVLSPFFDKKVMNETENNKLIGVRDNLLPKLLSGEVDVSGLQIEVA
ncbi:restriction endonuclease subunit S [Acinetobacter johnsonii]|uniref:restriction endonuclease subunit S n=1 Tax=Acinetobacter johnsonii TaxID=40214 RepID=UPI00293628DF|nr:restriction endonuclease subunit S [Acinetobacter johnsonii]MDV2487192.1 restriction endonuclease subunit S [Acinetobacter johnsonii]